MARLDKDQRIVATLLTLRDRRTLGPERTALASAGAHLALALVPFLTLLHAQAFSSDQSTELPIDQRQASQPDGESATVPAQPEAETTPKDTLTPEDSPSADKTFVIVEGQVTDHMGAGLRHVSVTVRWKNDAAAKDAPIATATTDEMGDFAASAAEAIQGDVIVALEKPTYQTQVRGLTIVAGERAPYLALSLEGNLVVVGRLLDAQTEKPVVGAVVRLESAYRDWSAETDANGHFQMSGVSPGKAELIAEAKGYGREVQPIDDLANVDEQIIRLKPERIVHLEIVDERGRPIPGVTVEVYDKLRDDFRMIVTDPSGSATLKRIHFDVEELTVRLSHDDHVSSGGFDRVLLVQKEPIESTHRLVLARAGRIAGTITDRATGRPLSAARIVTGQQRSDESPRDWANYQGRYEVVGVAPGEVTTTVHLTGHAPEISKVTVTAGKTVKLDVQLDAASVVRGIVKSEGGEPVQGARVETTRWRGLATLDLRATTDAEGGFVIRDAPSDEFEITVSAPQVRKVTRLVRADPEAVVVITVPDASADPFPSPSEGLRAGEAAPALELTTLDGRSFNLAKLKGKVVVLDFWATWCGPCVAELPDLAKIQKKFGPRTDFLLIGISLDGDKRALRDFVKKRRIDWAQVYGEAGGADEAADKFGVVGIPALFAIDKEGLVAASGMHASQLGELVGKLLDGAIAGEGDTP